MLTYKEYTSRPWSYHGNFARYHAMIFNEHGSWSIFTGHGHKSIHNHVYIHKRSHIQSYTVTWLLTSLDIQPTISVHLYKWVKASFQHLPRDKFSIKSTGIRV